jgi:uncharacterized protein YecE (DUF72 family)
VAPGACFIGCAGWSLPRAAQDRFGPGDSHLRRYATRLPATEINSSFHRAHSPAVYARWAASVPPDFRFCAKLPRTITHEARLIDAVPLLQDFLGQAAHLGERLGGLLVQLPPSLPFDGRIAGSFFSALRERWPGLVAAEPRHASWFTDEADLLLARHRTARVLADPVRHPAGAWPGGWSDLVYLRLHGTPRMYYSPYEPGLIEALARRITLAVREGRTVWCIFDNTAAGCATDNALDLQQALEKESA